MRRIILFVMALVVMYGGTVFANPFHETPNVWDNPNYKAVFAIHNNKLHEGECFAGFVDISSIVVKDIINEQTGDKGKEYIAIAYDMDRHFSDNGMYYTKSKPILLIMREYNNEYSSPYGEFIEKFDYNTTTGHYKQVKTITLAHSVGFPKFIDYYYIFHDFV